MKSISLQAQVEWKFFRDDTSKHWIAVCDALKQTVSAETWAELNDSIAETLDLLFRELLEKDELASFLRSHGWRLNQPIPEHRRNVRFDVPWKLIQSRGAYAKAAAMC
jgi:hypothetical protein